MASYRKVGRVVFEGKVYVDTLEASEHLLASCGSDFCKWRAEGMPYIMLRQGKQVKYFYHLPDCTRWFAGADFTDGGIEITEAALEVSG